MPLSLITSINSTIYNKLGIPLLQNAVPNLLFDFDAAKNVTTSGSNVTAWTDARMGVTTTLQATKPVYSSTGINNKPGISIGAGAYLKTSTLTYTPSNVFTLFVVIKYNGTIGNMGQFFATDGSWTNGCVHLFYNQISYFGNPDQGAVALTNGTPTILTLWCTSSTNSYWRINGVSTTYAYGRTTNFTFTNVDIGGWSGDTGRYVGGYYSEMLLFSRALTQTEINNVEKYLSYKWKIGIGSVPQIASSTPYI